MAEYDTQFSNFIESAPYNIMLDRDPTYFQFRECKLAADNGGDAKLEKEVKINIARLLKENYAD